jgi:hypothetical protein
MLPGRPTRCRAEVAIRRLSRSLLLAASLIGIGCEPPEPPPSAGAQQAGEQDEAPATGQPEAAPREPAKPVTSCAQCAASSAVTQGECRDLWLATQTPEDAPTLACITAQRCLDLRSVELAYQCIARCGHSAIEDISPPIDRLISCSYCACHRAATTCEQWVEFLDARLAAGACPPGK